MKNILVVEDNDLNMMLFCDILKAHSYKAIGAADGITALSLARRHHPSLILMDIQLPVHSGFEVIEWLKADVALRAIPIIAVTAYAMRHERERILKSGVEAYIAKPISIVPFIAEVRKPID
jgi:two-component system cell cycle response regulator DivK